MHQSENGFKAPSVEELAPLFPSYEILSLVAVGGMGAVYHAMQTSLEREVAIKILPAEFGEDEEFCANFGSEAKAMAKLNHPNLIGVYDFGEVDGMLFIVMEYVPGQSLHEASSGVPIDADEVIRMMTGISQGLAHAHQQGILHRDIKPANILLDNQMQPKIGDFGLARPVDAQVQEGETIFGTPGYTAPEVVDAPNAVDQRADIFSLGVLLHELLTGGLPETDPRPPSEIVFCDVRLDAVVQKATQPDPMHRYQDAAEMAEELEKIATTDEQHHTPQQPILQTVSPAPAAYKQPAHQPYVYQPAKKGGGAGMLMAILLAVGVVLVLIFRDQIFPQADPKPAPVTQEKPEPQKPGNPEKPGSKPEPPETDVTHSQVPKPGSDPVTPGPETHQLEPSSTNPELVHPGPGPGPGAPGLDPRRDPAKPDPGTKPEPVKAEPKFDVDGFLKHARSVMLERCEPAITKHQEALKKNVANFRSEAWKQARNNLDEKWHEAARREIDTYCDECVDNGNRMVEELHKSLKPKKWFVALYEEYEEREAEIDTELNAAFAKQQKTYLHGLGLRVKALEKEDDPLAVDLIKAEIDKVNDDEKYFRGLMLDPEENA